MCMMKAPIPEREGSFIGCFAGDATEGNVIGFHNLNSNLDTVSLEEAIQMLEGFFFLVGSRGQERVIGVMVEDVGFLIVRYGLDGWNGGC